MDTEKLRKQYEEIEDSIESAATDEYWRLADWLAKSVPPEQGARTDLHAQAGKLSLDDVSEWSRKRGKKRSVSWLGQLRKVALDTRDDRLPGVPVRVYMQAIAKHGSLEDANAALTRDGIKLRDHSKRMESPAAVANAAAQHTPQERAEIAAQLLADQETRRAAADLDSDARGALQAAGSMAEARSTQERDKREAASDGISTEQRRMERLRRLIRSGEFRKVGADLERDGVPDMIADMLVEEGERLRATAEWLCHWAEVRQPTDEDIASLLGN